MNSRASEEMRAERRRRRRSLYLVHQLEFGANGKTNDAGGADAAVCGRSLIYRAGDGDIYFYYRLDNKTNLLRKTLAGVPYEG
jgi:hypothetical protein